MLGLYLLAAHLVGDFVLQTRWQAAGKFNDRWLRTRHVYAYVVPFVPLALALAPTWWRAALFLCLLWTLHYATDSRRFHSTVGDWIGWRRERVRQIAVLDPAAYHRGDRITAIGVSGRVVGHRVAPDGGFASHLDVAFDLPPNPWTPIPILIDQTLHVCQLALLGGLFLS